MIDYCMLSKTQNSHLIGSQNLYNKLKHLIDKYVTKGFLNKLYICLLNTPLYELKDYF